VQNYTIQRLIKRNGGSIILYLSIWAGEGHALTAHLASASIYGNERDRSNGIRPRDNGTHVMRLRAVDRTYPGHGSHAWWAGRAGGSRTKAKARVIKGAASVRCDLRLRSIISGDGVLPKSLTYIKREREREEEDRASLFFFCFFVHYSFVSFLFVF
jgi:hypothetical protein